MIKLEWASQLALLVFNQISGQFKSKKICVFMLIQNQIHLVGDHYLTLYH